MKRARIPRARPNVNEAGRRGGAAVSNGPAAKPGPQKPKPAEVRAESVELEPKIHIRSPPPVRRAIVDLDTGPQATVLNQPTSDVCSDLGQCFATAEHDEEQHESERSVPEPVKSPAIVDVVPFVAPSGDLEPTQAVTKTGAKPAERKTSVGHENRDKPETVKRSTKYKKGSNPPERSEMLMFDLIYWNPAENPMRYEENEEEIGRLPVTGDKDSADNPNAERLAEEAVDDPTNDQDGSDEAANRNPDVFVPQVKIGPDGSIIIDERSLVVERTDANKDLSSSPIVYERSSLVTYASYGKKKCVKYWSDHETAKFYLALRSMKFKKEERANRSLVDKAMREQLIQYDLSVFDDFPDEDSENKGVKKAKRQMKKRLAGVNSADKEQQVNDGSKKPVAKKSQAKVAKRRKRKTLQEESDSDFEIIEQDKLKAIEKAKKCAESYLERRDEEEGDSEGVGENVPVANDTSESDDEDGTTSDELLNGLLQQTRSGRQPKKKSMFTIVEKEPKKRQRNGNAVAKRPAKCKRTTRRKIPPPSPYVVLPPTPSPAPSLIEEEEEEEQQGSLVVDDGQMMCFAENPKADGTRVIHVFRLGSPKATPLTQPLLSVLSDHDYSSPQRPVVTAASAVPPLDPQMYSNFFQLVDAATRVSNIC